jgi:hypothetical protein
MLNEKMLKLFPSLWTLGHLFTMSTWAWWHTSFQTNGSGSNSACHVPSLMKTYCF